MAIESQLQIGILGVVNAIFLVLIVVVWNIMSSSTKGLQKSNNIFEWFNTTPTAINFVVGMMVMFSVLLMVIIWLPIALPNQQVFDKSTLFWSVAFYTALLFAMILEFYRLGKNSFVKQQCALRLEKFDFGIPASSAR
jgi:hypothetical protein